MIACVCRNLSEEKVREILAQCPSKNVEQKLEEFKYFAGPATCGNCYDYIRSLIPKNP